MSWQSMLPAIGDFFASYPSLGIGFAGFIAFIESLAIIGSIVPGSIMMSIVGFLLGTGILPLKPTLISIFIGAFIGDFISYFIGAWYQDHFRNHHWVQPYHHWVSHGEAFMKRYGVFSIIIGRFFGPMRSIIPLIAGLANMTVLRFTIAIIPTIILWSIVYLAPGVLLGAISIDMGENYFIHLVSSFLIYLLLFGLWLSTHSILRIFVTQNSQRLTHIIKGSLLILFSIIIIYFQCFYAPETNWLNTAAYHYSLIQSTDAHIETAQIISLMSSHITYILVTFAIVLVLYYHYHKELAAICILFYGGLFAITTMLKYLLGVSRPNPIMTNTGFPSGHMFLFPTLLLSLSIQVESSSLLFAIILRRITFLLMFMIGISRLILQAHWALDVVASAFLALSIWHFLSIWKHQIPKIPFMHLRQIGAATLLIIIPYTALYEQLPTDIRPNIPKPLVIQNSRELDLIPKVRYSRLGQPVAPINFVYVGSSSSMNSYLSKEGFTKYPGTGNLYSRLKTLFHYSEYHDILPILPPLFDRRGPDFIYGKIDETHAYIIKLWKIKGKMDVHIGTVSLETYPESFFSPSLVVCQKDRFNIQNVFSEKRYFRKTEPYTISKSKNAFCWDGEIFFKQ